MILTVKFALDHCDLIKGLFLGCDNPSIRIEVIQLEDYYRFSPSDCWILLSARVNSIFRLIWIFGPDSHHSEFSQEKIKECSMRGLAECYHQDFPLLTLEGDLRIIGINQQVLDDKVRSCESKINSLNEEIEYLNNLPMVLKNEFIKDLVI